MKFINKHLINRSTYFFSVTLITLFLCTTAVSAVAEEYKALNGVKKIKAVFEVSMGSAKFAPVVFWAVRNSYNDQTVKALPEKPEVVVVFHGPMVKLITSSREGFTPEESKALDEFASMIRQMKAEGVTFEVCLYAAKVLGVDPATILPEIDHVGNGFISVIGYQTQGYSVVRIP